MKVLLFAVLLATVGFGETIVFDSSTATINDTSSPHDATIAATPDPSWATALPGSIWITTTGNTTPPIGTSVDFVVDLDITKAFNLALLDLGVFAADSATVTLDGTTLFTENTNLGTHCANGVIGCTDGTEGVLVDTDVTSLLHTGTNTLSFQVFQESNGTPFGLDFAGSLSLSSVATPEPSYATPLAVGLIGVVFLRIRLKRNG